jgi:hypothetical protein
MKGSMNMYTMKDLMEKATKISCYAVGDEAYDFEGHRIAICGCDRSSYVHVVVDGEVIATRAKKSNGLRLALAYLNK